MIACQTYRLGSRPGGHTSAPLRILRFTATTGALFLCAISSLANEARHLTLSEAVHLALQQNRTLKIARFKVQENEYRKVAARSDYLPTITNQSNILHITELENLSVPAGAFGVAASVPIPNSGTQLPQGWQSMRGWTARSVRRRLARVRHREDGTSSLPPRAPVPLRSHREAAVRAVLDWLENGAHSAPFAHSG